MSVRYIKEFVKTCVNIHDHRIIAKSSGSPLRDFREIRDAQPQAEVNQNQESVISATAGGGQKSPKCTVSRLAG
eukprot:1616140-Prymnesium_polylepis.1